jgi:hypothetical protein
MGKLYTKNQLQDILVYKAKHLSKKEKEKKKKKKKCKAFQT